MINDCLKLFGLTPDAALSDVKKAYRRLAKENHPDRFIDDEQKKKQQKKMTEINEAYKIIVTNFKKIKKSLQNSNKNKLDDTNLYKKGVEYFNKQYGFSNFFMEWSAKGTPIKILDQKTLPELEDNLLKAKSYFMRVLLEYPDSDWAYDSEEKLKKIERLLSLKFGEMKKNASRNVPNGS
jgi:curved DNA-binding protein CbpA